MKKVLIIRCGALGDLVYATSVIDALRYEYGEDTLIDFVCTPATASLFKEDYRVHQVFTLKHKKIPLLLSSDKKKIVHHSQKNPYDILINFEFGTQFQSLVNKTVAAKKIGPHTRKKLNFPPELKHMVDITKYIFKDIVSEDVYKKSFPRLIGTEYEKVLQKFNLPQKYIIISPSNSHQKRNILNYRAWENEKWKELIEKLSLEIPVVIVGGKNEQEFFQQLHPYPQNVIDLVGKTPLSELISVIQHARALVATDTGTAHIASAVNTHVFALIGPTPADVTGPYKSPFNKVNIITLELECSPCYKTETMKKCKDNICMKQISVEMVYNSIKNEKII